MSKNSPLHRNIHDVAALRDFYGVRFHHMITMSGRLVATLATEPVGDGNVSAVAAAICASGDSPSRFRGRQIALGRLEVGKSEEIGIELLKQEISDRSILRRFVGEKIAARLGYDSVDEFIADIRPRAPFIPKEEVV